MNKYALKSKIKARLLKSIKQLSSKEQETAEQRKREISYCLSQFELQDIERNYAKLFNAVVELNLIYGTKDFKEKWQELMNHLGKAVEVGAELSELIGESRLLIEGDN